MTVKGAKSDDDPDKADRAGEVASEDTSGDDCGDDWDSRDGWDAPGWGTGRIILEPSSQSAVATAHCA